MKKYFLLFIFCVSFCKFSSAQILCIYCYDQNDSLSDNVNNLVVNGGFENTTCYYPPIATFCPNATSSPHCNIANWNCTGGGISTYAHIVSDVYSIIAEGAKAPYFGNLYSYPCSATLNDTFCIYMMGCTVAGIPVGHPYSMPTFGMTTGVSLEQSVTGLAPGNIYVLEFWAGGEADNGPFIKDGLFAVDVGFGDTLLKNRPTSPLFLGDPDTIGTRFIIEFIATSSSHTIKFTNWGHICHDCTELIIDDVRLYTLAELDAAVPHCSVGISPTPTPSTLGGEGVVIIPNPFSNELSVKINSNQLSEIILYDVFSKKLLQQTFANAVSINTEKFSKGIYFYEIKPVPISSGNIEGVVKKGKVIKE